MPAGSNSFVGSPNASWNASRTLPEPVDRAPTSVQLSSSFNMAGPSRESADLQGRAFFDPARISRASKKSVRRSGTSNIPSGDARIRSGNDANTDYPKSIPYNSNRGPDDPNRGSDDAHRSVPPLSRRFRL